MVYIVGLHFTIQLERKNTMQNTNTVANAITTAKVAALIGLGCHEQSKVMGNIKKVGEISGHIGTTSAAVVGVHALTGTPMYIGVYKVLKVAALAGLATSAACGIASLGYITAKAVQHIANGNARRLAEAASEADAEEDAGEQPAEA